MPDRVRLVLGLVVLLAGLLLPAPPSFACSSSTVSGWTTNDGAGLSASCGTTVVQRPTADAVKVSTNDRGISTHAIPAPVIPAPIAKSCNDLIDNCPTIPEPTTPPTPPPPGAPPPITTTVLREAATRITLPTPTPSIGPDPSANPWHIVAIGYPIWLWTPGPDTITSTVTTQGITVSITAHRTATTFDMGDTTTLRCTTMTPYPGPSTPPAESPTCGHRYQKLPTTEAAGYTIHATSHWTVTWTALGQTGTFTMTRSATRHIDVAEIHTVVTAR